MKTIYKTILILFYCLGLLIISAANFSRVCFYVTWPPKDDLKLWILIIVIFLFHYGFFVLGYNLKYLTFKVLFLLRKIDIMYGCFQLAIILLLWVLSWFDLSFYAVYPMLITPVIALVLRILITNTMNKTGDGSVC